MGKTGTTALQSFFWTNRKALRDYDISYPEICAVSGAHHLASPHVPVFLEHTGWRFMDPDEWIPEVKKLPNNTILMSSELMAWASPEKVLSFCNTIKLHFNVIICIYLRRQDDMIMAAYGQQIKAGTQTKKIVDTLDKQVKRFDYLRIINPWEEALGFNNLIVLPYEKKQFYNNDLISDFLWKVLKIKDFSKFTISEAKIENPRLPLAVQEFKRLINNIFPRPQDSEPFNKPLSHYAFLTQCEGSDNNIKELLSYEQRKSIVDYFAESNRFIAKKYLQRKDAVLFYEPLTTRVNERSHEDFNELTNANLEPIMKYIKRENEYLYLLLIKGMHSALKSNDLIAMEAAEVIQRIENSLKNNQPIKRREELTFASLFRAKKKYEMSKVLFLRIARKTMFVLIKAKNHIINRSNKNSRVIIHYGVHKTGSTSLQLTLFKNQNRLKNFVYIHFGQANGSFAISEIFRGYSSRTSITKNKVSRNDLTISLYNLNGKTGIISAEVISVFTPEQVKVLIDLINECGFDPYFVGYVRDPVGYYTSMFQQSLKTKSVDFNELRTWVIGGQKSNKPYYQTLSDLKEISGEANVAIYPFDKRNFPDGNVVKHFLSIAGFGFENIEIFSANTSLSHLAVKALYVYRKFLVPDDNEVDSVMPFGRFIKLMEKIPGNRYMFSVEINKKILDLCSDYHNWADKNLIKTGAEDKAEEASANNLNSESIVFAEEKDLMQFSENEIDKLQKWAKVYDSNILYNGNNAKYVAWLVHNVRCPGKDQVIDKKQIAIKRIKTMG